MNFRVSCELSKCAMPSCWCENVWLTVRRVNTWRLNVNMVNCFFLLSFRDVILLLINYCFSSLSWWIDSLYNEVFLTLQAKPWISDDWKLPVKLLPYWWWSYFLVEPPLPGNRLLKSSSWKSEQILTNAKIGY